MKHFPYSDSELKDFFLYAKSVFDQIIICAELCACSHIVMLKKCIELGIVSPDDEQQYTADIYQYEYENLPEWQKAKYNNPELYKQRKKKYADNAKSYMQRLKVENPEKYHAKIQADNARKRQKYAEFKANNPEAHAELLRLRRKWSKAVGK